MLTNFDIFRWTWRLSGGPTFPDEAAERRTWERARPQAWARVRDGQIPRLAKRFDGLEDDATWRFAAELACLSFEADRVRPAIEADRAAVRAFEADNPAGARAVRDSLDRWLAHLDELARECDRLDGTAQQDRFAALKRKQDV